MNRYLFLAIFLFTCNWHLSAQNDNPAALGFNATASDTEAIAIADEVMQAMGGRTAYDNTRYLQWTFFGRRTLLWDKWTGRVRIDFTESDEVYLVDIHTGNGKIYRDGAYLNQPDSLAKYTARAKSIWINDAYWLVMPYKLKDSGVTLKYLGTEGSTDSLQHQLQLTFVAVGDTPDNKYIVLVDDDSKLVSEWRFYEHFDDEKARFSTPWAEYQTYGNILLSGDRGRAKLTNIGVFNTIPDRVFESAEAVNVLEWE